MVNLLDEKDRKILVELDKNARQTDSEIAKKVGVSKQVANYRIQQLVQKGIINNFYTAVNVGKLGLNSYYVFMQLEKLNEIQEKELLEKLSSLPYIGWLVNGTGRWDLILMIYAESVTLFDSLLNEVLGICGEHLHEYEFTILLTAEHLTYGFLKNKNQIQGIKQTEKESIIELDEIDKKILKTMSQNARLAITEIALKIKEPIHVVNYHLKNLIKKKVIEGFKPKLDANKLDYQWHLLLIQFQNVSQKRKKEFMNYCKQQDNIYYLTNTIGNYNVTLDVHVKTTQEFRDVLFELKNKFSDVIKVYEDMIIFNEYKISYFPEELI